MCYFKALQLGDINKVVPIDKSSTILTLLLAFIFLHESISLPKAIGVVIIDKLSILVTIVFSYFVFHEKLTKKSGLGLVLIVGGTLAMLIA